MTTTQPKRQPIPFGKYLLLDRINIGGMAEVWRGKAFGAGGFERLVAIKRILPNIAEDDEFISMFIDEAKISVQLTHANIAQIYELGQIANSYFIAMEYIPGKDMRAIFDRCRKKAEPAPIPLVAYCVSKMCEGLDYAHRKKDGMGRDLNIVHRDISPQNILISYEGEVKVIDFGIAKAAGKATKTQAGILKGKFGYMSPEQIRGLNLDRRSDVFAIGVCLYEMLTGERLFVGDSDFSVLEKVRKAEVAPPSTYNRRIPENLEKIVMKALARDVDERYQYASELGDDLQRFLITSETIFGRKDLMQYMKSTFAEDVEREKQRLQDYASIRPPDGMLSAIEAGFSGSSPMATLTPVSAPAPTPVVAPVEPARSPPAQPVTPRSASLTAMPRLTAAPVAPPPKDDEAVATMLVDSSEYFNDNGEPKTNPGSDVGRAVTPLENQAVQLGEGDPPITGKTAVIGPPGGAQRPPSNIPVVTPAPNVQVRPSVFGMPAVAAPEPAQGSLHGRPSNPGRGADGLPPIVRPDRPAGGPPVLGPGSHASGGGTPRPATMPPRPAPPPAVVPPPEPVASGAGGGNRLVIFGGIGAAFFALLGVLAFVLLRSPSQGFIMVELPPQVRSKAQVKLNAEDVAPTSGDILQQVPAGEVIVTVAAEGYKTFQRTVTVAEGTNVTRLVAELEPLVKTTMMVLATDPPDAEVRVNGKVVRAQGAKDILIRDVPASPELEVEVLSPGFKRFRQKVAASTDSQPVQVSARLEAAELEVRVESEPAGATILASGKELGAVTPAVVTLPAGTRQLTLKMKCFEDANLPVSPTGSSELAVVKGALKKQPDCK